MLMTDLASSLLEHFEQQQISAPGFGHRDHVQVAFEMLEAYEFVDACTRYACTIRAMAESVDVLEKYNATITFAFMSLIAERKSQMGSANLESFLEENPDLLNRNVLKSYYTDERLASATARRQFLLPDKVSGPKQGAA